MFVVLVGAVLVTLLLVRDIAAARRRPVRPPDRALALVHAPLRQLRRGDGGGARQGAGRDAPARAHRDDRAAPDAEGTRSRSRRPDLRKGDRVVVEAGQVIPGDGTVVEGIASVDESAITGESAPVIRESGGDRSAVTGGTRVLSDRIVVEITSNPGETFLDRMIALVEGASRQKTPNEIALSILLAGLTIVFLIATVTLRPFAIYAKGSASDAGPDRAARLPHSDDDRRPALGDRHRRDGPGPSAQRARDVRARGRSRRRRQRPAPRQDRDDHARQPPGDRLLPRAQRAPAAIWPKAPSSPRSPTRRRKGDRSSCSPRRSSACAARRVEGMSFIAVLRHDPDVRRGLQRTPDPQGRGRLGHGLGPRRRAGRSIPPCRIS